MNAHPVRPLPIVLVAVLAGSCGGSLHTEGDADGDTSSPDTAPDTTPDTGADPTDTATETVPDTAEDPAVEDAAPPDCTAWFVVEREATGIRLAESLPVNTERTFRVALDTTIGGCEERAMPRVTVDESSRVVDVVLRVWDARGMDCPDMIRDDVRWVSLRLPTAGTWTVRDASGSGTVSLAVDVQPGPPRPCSPGSGMCEMDCDCPHDGTVCLSGFGVAGPFSDCVHPCEEVLDCHLGGPCTAAVLDYLENVCFDESDLCAGDSPCPDGWICEGNRCTPDFWLDSGTRGECGCDADCSAPLSCTLSDPGATTGRCEIRCATSGWWCSGMHFCGEAAQDVAGLAVTDSVCVWYGE